MYFRANKIAGLYFTDLPFQTFWKVTIKFYVIFSEIFYYWGKFINLCGKSFLLKFTCHGIFHQCKKTFVSTYPAGNYMFKINNRNARTRCEICSKLTMKILFLRLLCISINLPYAHVWNTVVMSGLVPLVATWNCWTSYKNEYAGLLVLHLLLLLNPWLIVEMWPA